jgi:DNA-binding MarR family transcriptional regulator
MHSTADATAQKLSQSLMQFNKAFMQFHRAALNQHLAGCKMSEIGVLCMISKGTKSGAREMKVSEISKMMHVTSPSITQVLKGLEANGLVERHIDPTDRRSVGIALTERGKEVAQKAEEAFLISFHGLVEYLGEEQSNELASLLSRAFRYFNERMSNMYQSPWNGDEEA